MDELLAQGIRFVRMAWHYRWIALGAAFAICVVGWTMIMTLPDRYVVNTKVLLDTRSSLTPLLRGLAVNTNAREQAINMVRRTLLSRDNLEAVIRTTDMDLTAKTPEDFERLINHLRRAVRVSGGSRGNIFSISYTHADPQRALRVVEAVLNIFVEKSLGESRKDSSSTRQFIEQQIKDHEARLNVAEERLKEFKRRNLGMMPGEGGNYYSQRQSVVRQLEDAQLSLNEAINRRNEIRRQVEEGRQFADPESLGIEGPFSRRIRQLEEQLDNLLLKYTDRHPDVVASKELLAQLRKQNKEAIAEMMEQLNAEDAEGKPLSEYARQVQLTLGQAEAEVAGLSTRVENYKQKLSDLERRIDEALNVEREYKALDRDYNIIQRNYQELAKRREQLSISEEVSQSTDQIQFNIIEPPRAPIHPNSPDRITLSSAVLLVGLGAGLALAIVVAMIRPAFYTRIDLATVSDLPVLGAVSRILTPKENVQRRLGYAAYLGGVIGLVGVYFGLVTLYTLHINPLDKVQQLVA
ncbi:MAG: XrtA system polysaccharide chain length determinant [Gammaproteobacteria bacterium]|nr:XrtA system polysaccharide chain length determinant [Gammaproteobacteria bacterium]